MPQWFPALRRATLPAVEQPALKAVLADYYAALASAGVYTAYRSKPWPVERAVAEAYERIVWVFKAVDAIAGHQSRLPFWLKQGEEVVDDHPIYRVLGRTAKANPLETARQFRKRLSAQLLLSKRGAFVEVTLSRGGTITRLDLLPPGRTRPVPGAGQELLSHFEVIQADGTRKTIEPENVRWFRDPHPLDPFSGVTPLEAAGLSTELDLFSRLYNVAFLKNDARPGGVLAINGEMDEREMDRVEDRFGKGPTEAGKLTVVNGEVSYVDLATRPRDMQYETTTKTAKVEILSAFGVGESVIGYAADRTFDNAEQELYNFWTITMPPHLDLIATGFDEDSEVELETVFDTSGVEVLQRAEAKRREEARAEFEAGLISPDEYREAAGRKAIGNASTRALYIPSGKTPVPTSEADAVEFGLGDPLPAAPEDDGTGGGLPSPDEVPEIDAAAAQMAAEEATKRSPSPAGPVPAPYRMPRPVIRVERVDEGKARPEPAEGEGWETSEPDLAAHDRLEATLAAALHALGARLTERSATRLSSPKQRKGTRHWVAEYPVDTRVGTKALDAGQAVDGQRWQEEAQDTTRPIVEAAAGAAAGALLADLATTQVDPAGVVRGVVDQVVEAIGTAARAFAERLIEAAAAADREGLSIEEVSGRVRGHSARLDAWAGAVAATAATATMAGARDAAAVAAVAAATGAAGAAGAAAAARLDIVRMWRTRGDERVRPSHVDAHGQTQKLGVPFAVGAALLRFPGDPQGPPEEVINCRCVLHHRHRRTGRFVAPPAGEVTRHRPEAKVFGVPGRAAVVRVVPLRPGDGR